jgi:acyl-CoA synthetase (NDP forming)/RimJ/RimL family protein N-acetyltransferase
MRTTADLDASAATDEGVGRYALLTDGSTVEIRPARKQDAEAIRQLHAAMSPDNIYLRFFSLSPLCAEREALRICRPAGPDHVALVAWRGGEAVGVASYERNGATRTAEVAFSVADGLHGHGIGTLLLDRLVSVARQQHLMAFTAETLAENTAMLGVFAAAGLPVRRSLVDGVVDLTIPLPVGAADVSLAGYLAASDRRESRADVASLRHLFAPGSVAVIGASRRENSVGARILGNVVASGFAGPIYPVNPHAAELAGLPCVPSVAELPEAVDVAIVAVPAPAVVEVAEQCGRRGVRTLVVITSGIGAVGPELLAACRQHGMRLVGPNCFGVAMPWIGLDATFGRHAPAAGFAGLAVQSGGIGIALTEHLSSLGVGVSSFLSMGDKYDVSGNDVLTWWEQDERTRLGVLYLESFGYPRRFARTARRVGRSMPVLTVLAGRSEGGQRAAQSHTAAAASPVVTREALFEQAGVIVTASLGELIEAAAFLSCQPHPAGGRVAMVTNAGGAGVLAADACADNGLLLASLSEPTLGRLRALLPEGAAIANPVDTTAAVSADLFRDCLEAVGEDGAVDAVIAVVAPTAMADLRQAMTAAALAKPLSGVLLDQEPSVCLLPRTAPGPRADSPAVQAVPCYAYPEGAARALGRAARYGAWRSRSAGRLPELPEVRADDARDLVASFLAGNQDGGWLPAAAVRELLDCYQIPQVPTALAESEQAAVEAAAGFGGPVVLKAEVTGLVHKSDAGAVRLDLRGGADVAAAYAELAARFGPDLRQVLVQPMLTGGTEVLVGVAQEPVFGPLIVFGAGGVTADVVADHAARLSPLTDADARDLIASAQVARLLAGYRNVPPADLDAVADVLLRVSRLADDSPEVVALDLNPVIARADGCVAVDARIELRPTQPHDPYRRQLR